MNNLNDSTSFTPFYRSTCNIHRIILKNDLETLKQILSDERRDCLNDLDHSGRMPLHVSLLTANPKALYLLLYYPLIHPSKRFATSDWIDNLKESSGKCVKFWDKNEFGDQFFTENFHTEFPSKQNFTLIREFNQILIGEMDVNDGIEYISSEYIDYTKARMGKQSLSSRNKPSSEYLNSRFTNDARNLVNGYGQKEVENLYEEHYKFIVGETHELETAVKNYSQKYDQIYNWPPSRVQWKDLKKNHRLDNLGQSVDPVKPTENQLSYEKSYEIVEMDLDNTSLSSTYQNISHNQPYFNIVNQLEITTSGKIVNGSRNEDRCVMVTKRNGVSTYKLAHKLSSELVDKCYEGLLPLETVDLISTFDKTFPLHLLFSNVYISSYRPNILKCYRILLCYFNKFDEFQKACKSLKYTLCPSTHSFSQTLNQCTLNKSAGTEGNTDLHSRLNKFNNKRDNFEHKVIHTRANKYKSSGSKDHLESTDIGVTQRGNVFKPPLNNWKYWLKDLFNEFENDLKRSGSYATQGMSFPNNTSCVDSFEMTQETDTRINTLLNPISSEPSNKTDSFGRLHKCGSISNSIHKTISSFVWLKPKISWETFTKNRDFSKSTIFHRVCNLRDISLVKCLLASGFSPSVVNESGDMPVHLSVDSKDPYTFLTILHYTLENIFLYSYNSGDNTINTEDSVNSDNIGVVDTFEKFMKSLCEGLVRRPKNSIKQNLKSEFKEFGRLSRQSIKILFDEFLMLFEQIVYRSIKSSSWECLIALLSYNSAITYHLISNPCFMHRFINFATMMNNQDQFLSIVNFTLTSLYDNPKNDTVKDHTNYKKHNKRNEQSYFKGCGIPHSDVRLSIKETELGPQTYHLGSDSFLFSLIRNCKRSVKPGGDAMKTWIITHPTCLHHLAIPEPTDFPNKRYRLIMTYPENPTRLEVIISNDNGLLRSDTLENVKLIHSPPPASMADILRVHDWAYIDKLLDQVQVAQKRWDTHPYWPVLADGDTPVTPHSWSAALYAAGSVLSAVDAVCTNQCKNAFCAVRPPGHHLGTWGAAQSNSYEDEDFAAGSQGFCLINNVAIGAAYAKYMYASKGIRRIAIVDFDVHHGNGTEQIVRNIGPKNVKVNIDRFNINTEPNPISKEPNIQHIHKKWFGWRDENDRDEVLFTSIHAYDGIFYPGTGYQSIVYQEENRPNIINVAVPEGTTSSEFRSLFETKICPYLYHFKPDLIFISAGFDGHYRDSVSYGFTRYTEKDFNYVTELLVTVANTVCEGRIVSVLEGGYNTKLSTLSPFARSVLEHATALSNTGRNRKYPFAYGESMLNHLFSPVVKTLESNQKSKNSHSYTIPSLSNSVTNPENCCEPKQTKRNANTELMLKTYKLRAKTDLLTSKLYSKCSKFCHTERLLKFDRSNMCSKFVFEFYGNVFYSYYSKFFYTLFGISPTLKSSNISTHNSLNTHNTDDPINGVIANGGFPNSVRTYNSLVTSIGNENEKDILLVSLEDFVISSLEILDSVYNNIVNTTSTGSNAVNTAVNSDNSVVNLEMVNEVKEVESRDLEEVLMNLRVVYHFKESEDLMSRNTWAANEKLSALNRNLEIVTILENFYSKFSYLFDKECLIH